MATTVATYPGSTSAIARTSATTWTNTGNIVSDNATDATCNNTTGNGSYYLVASNFGFAIPTGRPIAGVTVVVQASEHSTGTEVLNAQLQNASGTLFGGSKTRTISGTTKVNYTYGGNADVWAATLTADIINDPDFGVRVWFTTSHDIRIDFIRMIVDYGDEIVLAAPSALTLTGNAPALSLDYIVTPGVGELTAEGYAPTVERSSEDVRVSYARLSILTTDVRVSFARLDTLQTTNIVPGTGELVVSSYPVTVDQTTSRTITAGLGEVTATGYAPQVFAGDFIYIGTGTLPVLGFSPAVAQTANHFVAVGLGEATAEGYAPNLQGNYNISPDVGALAIEGFAPSVGQDRLITPGVGEITASGHAPFVLSGAADVRVSHVRLDTQNNVRSIGVGEITVTGYPPAIGAIVLGGGGHRDLTWTISDDPGVNGYWIYYDTASRGDDAWQDYRSAIWVSGRTTDSYTVSGLDMGRMYYFNMSSDGGSGLHTVYESELVGEFSAEALESWLVAAGHAPVVEQTREVFKAPGVGEITIAGYAPSLDITAVLELGALTVEGYAATVGQTANQWIAAGVGAVTATGYPVTTAQETINSPVVRTGELTAQGFAPTVEVNNTSTIGAGTLTAEGYAPGIVVSDLEIIYVGTGDVTAEGFAPTVAVSALVWVDMDVANTLTVEGFAPSLLEEGAFTIVPGTGAVVVDGHTLGVENSVRTRGAGAKRKRRVIFEDLKEDEKPAEIAPKEAPKPKMARKAGKAAPEPEVEPAKPQSASEPDTTQREAERETDLIINAMIKRQEAEEMHAIMQILIEEDRLRREKIQQLLRDVEAMINPDEDEEALMLLLMAV